MAGKIPQGSRRELAPEGTHNAVCIQVIDLGTQPSEKWGDKRKVQLAWQLVDEETKEGKAVVTYKRYTFSSSPKSSLMIDLKAWMGIKGRDFEMDNCLGKPCLLTIEHSETENGTYDNVTNLSGLPKGVKVKKHTEPLKSLYLDSEFDKDVFEDLPDFLQAKILATPEYEAVTAATKPKGKPPTKKK